MNDTIKELIHGLKDKLVEYRRNFHVHAESGWTEFRTTSVIARALEDLGYQIKMGDQIICKESMMGVPDDPTLEAHMKRAVDQGADPELVKKMEGGLTGVVADLDCGDGPFLALRFDIDANDISEAQDDKHRPFREGFTSINPNVMHACGHDGHAAMGLVVAEILSQIRDRLKGKIRLIFQPGEEGVRGAKPMIDAGILEGVDTILGGHIGFQAAKTGMLICSTDKFLATTKFDATFTGEPSHAGGAPEQGRNALLAAASAALNLHAITRHGQGASRITVGTIQAGQGRNVIPPNALIKVETRGETSEIDEFMFQRARQILAGSAQSYDVEVDIKLMGKTSSGQSSPQIMEIIKNNGQKIEFFNPDQMIDNTEMRGSEDYSHMMTVVQEQGGKGTYFMIGTDLAAGHHNFYFDFDESCLAPGVELIVRSALDILS